MKLFIPFISHEYSNLLSSMSIAPPIFYKQRNFGYNNLTPSILSPSQECLLGYDQPVFLEPGIRDNDYGFTINLETDVEEELLEIATIKDVQVYQINSTVYLNQNSKFIFKTPDQLNESSFLTDRALDVKFETWAKKSYRVLNDGEYHKTNHKDLDHLHIRSNNRIGPSTEFDAQLNKILGTLLGHAIGEVSNINQVVSINIGDLVVQQQNFIKELINEIAYTSNNKGRVPEDYYLRMSDVAQQLSHSTNEIQKRIKQNIDVNTDKIDFYFDNSANIIFKFCDTDSKEDIILTLIINYFLDQAPIKKTEELHTNKISHIESVGKFLKDFIGEEWETSYSDIRKYLLELLKSVKTKKLDHELRPDLDDSIKALTILLTTGRSLEKYLDECLYKYKIKPKIALSIHGAVYGMQNMPRTLTNVYLHKENNVLSFINIISRSKNKLEEFLASKNKPGHLPTEKNEVEEQKIDSILFELKNYNFTNKISKQDKEYIIKNIIDYINKNYNKDTDKSISKLHEKIDSLSYIRGLGPKTLEELKKIVGRL